MKKSIRRSLALSAASAALFTPFLPAYAAGERQLFEGAKPPETKVVDIAAVREEFSALHTKTTGIIEKATAEKRELTKEEQTEVDQAFSKMETFKKLEELHAKNAQHAFTTGKVVTPADPQGKEEAHPVEIKVGDATAMQAFFAKPENRKKFCKDYSEWSRTGVMPQQFATVTTATANSALLPKAVMAPMVPSAPNAIRQMLDALGLEPLETDNTNDISIPVASATAGGKVTETANSETENPPGFGTSILLHANMYQSGTTYYSNLVMNANNFDIVSATVPALYYSKELALESDILTTMVADTTITQKVTLATGTGLTGFTYQNLVSLNRILPKRYAYQKAIILSKAAYTAAENLVTTTGFPILNQDAQNSELKRFNGTPVLWSDYLASFGANNVIGMVISNLGFRLRDCDATNMIQRYTQLPARPAQTGFNLFCAHAFGYDANAVAELVCPAS